MKTIIVILVGFLFSSNVSAYVSKNLPMMEVVEVWVVTENAIRCANLTITELKAQMGEEEKLSLVMLDGKHFLSIYFARDETLKGFEIYYEGRWTAHRAVPNVKLLSIIGELITAHNGHESPALEKCMSVYLDNKNI